MPDPKSQSSTFTHFIATYDDSAYRIGASDEEIALQFIKLRLEADMQVYVNFVSCADQRSPVASMGDVAPVSPVFNDLLILLLNQLYLLRRDTLAKLIQKISQEILKTMWQKTQATEEWGTIRGKYVSFAGVIEKYFFAEDFSALLAGLRHVSTIEERQPINSAGSSQKQAAAVPRLQVLMETAQAREMDMILACTNRNNPIQIAKTLKTLQDNQQAFEDECQQYKQYFPVDALSQFRKKYILAYQHYVDVVNDMQTLLVNMEQDGNAFNDYIAQVNLSIVADPARYVQAMLLELANQKVRLNAKPTAHHTMRRLLHNALQKQMSLLYAHYCNTDLFPCYPSLDTLDAFVDDAMQPTTQLSVLVLRAQLRLLRVPVRGQQLEELEWADLPHTDDEFSNEMDVLIEKSNKKGKGDDVAVRSPPLVLASLSAKKIREVIAQHQQDFKKAEQAAACHEQRVTFFQCELAARKTYQKTYASIITYWQERGSVGGFFANLRQAANTPYYCIDENNDDDMAQHAEAKKIFYTQLGEQGISIIDIVALWTVAEPCINRHRNDFWDIVVGKDHTNSWRAAMSAARTKASELLQVEAKEESNILNNGVLEKKMYYAQWRNHSLFAEHRNDSILMGAWGRTSTQAKIDTEIKACDRALKKK
jgi:hypothetical protein